MIPHSSKRIGRSGSRLRVARCKTCLRGTAKAAPYVRRGVGHRFSGAVQRCRLLSHPTRLEDDPRFLRLDLAALESRNVLEVVDGPELTLFQTIGDDGFGDARRDVQRGFEILCG